MKPFAELTDGEQTRRLRQLALAALEHYDLGVSRVTRLALETNALFLVETPGRR